MDEKDLKALVEALIIHTRFDGIMPTYGAYRENYEEVQAEINAEVKDVLDTFKILKEENDN